MLPYLNNIPTLFQEAGISKWVDDEILDRRLMMYSRYSKSTLANNQDHHLSACPARVSPES